MSRSTAVGVTVAVLVALGLLAALLLREDPAPASAETPSRPTVEPGLEPALGFEAATPAPRREVPRPAAPSDRPSPHLLGLVVRKSPASTLPGVRITLRPAPGQAGAPIEVFSDAAGAFEIPVAQPLPGATLVAEWTPVTRVLELGDETEEALPRLPIAATLVTVEGDYTSGVPKTIRLDTGWVLGGIVHDGLGRPLHGVSLRTETGNAATSGVQGEFAISDIDPVALHVKLTGSAPGHLSASVVVEAPPAGQPAAHAQLVLPEPGVLHGIVTFGNGVPAENVEVVCVGRDVIAPGPHFTRTATDGSFRLENLPEGASDLVLRVPDDETRYAGATDAIAETWLRDLRITGEMPPQSLVIGKGLTLRGTVRDDEGRPLLDHLVVARAIRDLPCDPTLWSAAASAVVGSGGKFTLRRLQPGPWRLSVEGLPHDCEHKDHYVWLSPASANAGPALAQDGPNPGPPRPTELVFDVTLTPTTPDVELVVRTPADALPNVPWPEIRAQLPSGLYEYGLKLELIRGGSTIARSEMRNGRFPDYRPDANSAAGLLRFTDQGCLPLIRELHSLPLEHEVGRLEFTPAPLLYAEVTDAEGGGPVEDVSFAVHWVGGGSPDTVVFNIGDDPGALADRREARWVLTVEAPGYRRHRATGDAYTSVRAGAQPVAVVPVKLRRW